MNLFIYLWLGMEDHVSEMSKEVTIPIDGAIDKSVDCSDAFNTTEVIVNCKLFFSSYHHVTMKISFFIHIFRFFLPEKLC